MSTPDRRKQLEELNEQVAQYKQAAQVMEDRIEQARLNNPDSPEVLASLQSDARKVALAKRMISDFEREAKRVKRQLGRAR